MIDDGCPICESDDVLWYKCTECDTDHIECRECGYNDLFMDLDDEW
jgi:Zn ribbon nucleic-acid-binding protein